MCWTKLTIGAASALTLAFPAAADVIVVRASGPSATRYPPGKSLPDNARVTLARGDQVVLLDAKGTRTLQGPGAFPASGGPGAAGPSVLGALTSTATDRRSRVGAVREFPIGEDTIRPNVFFVDVAASGPACIVDPAAVQIWRAASESAGNMIVTGDDGASATLGWIKGQSIQPWPAALPVAQGRGYTIGGDSGVSARITFELLAQPPVDLPGLAKALIAHGCGAQIGVVIAAISAPGPR